MLNYTSQLTQELSSTKSSVQSLESWVLKAYNIREHRQLEQEDMDHNHLAFNPSLFGINSFSDVHIQEASGHFNLYMYFFLLARAYFLLTRIFRIHVRRNSKFSKSCFLEVKFQILHLGRAFEIPTKCIEDGIPKGRLRPFR